MSIQGTGALRAVSGLAALALISGAAGCGGGGAETGPRTEATILAPSDVQPAVMTELSGGIVLTGSLNPYQVVDVKAQVPGTIHNLRVDRGDDVQSGQTMATIEAEGIRGEAAGAQAAVASAQANLALANQQLQSATTLHDAGAMSDLDFESAQAAREAARAQLAAARAQATSAGEAARRATVVAPITGQVSNRIISEGEAVTTGQSLFTVVSTDQLELYGQVPVDEAARVAPGQPAQFTIDAYPGRVFQGKVARVDPTADPATRQVGVYLRLANPNHELVGGLFATGRVLAGGSQKALTVPSSALRQSGDSTYVWLIQDGKAVTRPVQVGVRDEVNGTVSILSGLKEGEQVVVSPGELTEGAPVQVANDNAASSAEAR